MISLKKFITRENKELRMNYSELNYNISHCREEQRGMENFITEKFELLHEKQNLL